MFRPAGRRQIQLGGHKRCRDVDLGAWASGEYRLPAQGEDEGDGEGQAGAAATPPIAPGPTH
jgi:hypothetical protein